MVGSIIPTNTAPVGDGKPPPYAHEAHHPAEGCRVKTHRFPGGRVKLPFGTGVPAGAKQRDHPANYGRVSRGLTCSAWGEPPGDSEP